jgi:ppGpp synthetase/RelA/SpoT-type nucleotidyltranferase
MYGDDIPPGKIREEYEAVFPALVTYAFKLRSLVGEFCAARKIKILDIETRAKEIDSLVDKFQRHPDYQWLSDAEDLCGVRIVTFYLDDVIAVGNMLHEEFEIRETEDRRTATPEAFGYQSLHLIGRLPEERRKLTEFRPFADFKIEFQIRTVLQHAWAVISHAHDYKTEGDIPAEVRRKLFRVAALLETGDELFGVFRTEVEEIRARYRSQVTTEEWRNLPLNLDSALASWGRLPVDKVRRAAKKAGFSQYDYPKDPSSHEFRYAVSKLISLAVSADYQTLDDLATLMDSVEGVIDLLSMLVHESKQRDFIPVGDPCDVVVLSMLLRDPGLRVRGATVPFRPPLEDALDAVIHSKDKS